MRRLLSTTSSYCDKLSLLSPFNVLYGLIPLNASTWVEFHKVFLLSTSSAYLETQHWSACVMLEILYG